MGSEMCIRDRDMESYGVALAASMCSTPGRTVHAVIVKGVVDYANGSKNDDWHDYAAYASAAFARHVLEATYDRAVAFRKNNRHARWRLAGC